MGNAPPQGAPQAQQAHGQYGGAAAAGTAGAQQQQQQQQQHGQQPGSHHHNRQGSYPGGAGTSYPTPLGMGGEGGGGGGGGGYVVGGQQQPQSGGYAHQAAYQQYAAAAAAAATTRKSPSDVSMSDAAGRMSDGGGGGGIGAPNAYVNVMQQQHQQQGQGVGNAGQQLNHLHLQQQGQGHPGPTEQQMQGGGTNLSAASLNHLNFPDDETVPTVFRWEHGGRQVYITGTFNDWSRQIPMHRSGNDFTYIHNLRKGKHAFKFIVDDEWRFAPDQPTVADIEGRINNFIDVSEFKPYTGDRNFEESYESGTAAALAGSGVAAGASATKVGAALDDDNGGEGGGAGGAGSQPGVTTHTSVAGGDQETFSHTMPDLDEYTKEPPPLPPHLRHIILNKAPQLSDTAALPVPQHVALNHLYCTAIKDNMMVLGITQRYKTKFVTTVYYSPCAS